MGKMENDFQPPLGLQYYCKFANSNFRKMPMLHKQ